MKRIVIAGCRDYENYEEAKEFIEACLKGVKEESIILSGGAKGADGLGERYAREKGWSVERYPAEWEKYGRGAGPRRNQKMAEACDMALCFWDGQSRGTKSMIGLARKLGKKVVMKEI